MGKKSLSSKKKYFPVVGVGASAGGLEALTELFKYIPADIGMAFVIVQHMDPSHESMLKAIIGRSTNMPVLEVTNLMPLEEKHIYVIPPNKNMTIVNGLFKLIPRTEKLGAHLPINWFFSSLAKEKLNQAIGVILSGSASDGVIGQKEIKSRGGITFSQDPASARYKGMPESAIRSGAIDYILKPKAIAKKLIDLGRRLPIKKHRTLSIQESVSKVKGDLAKIFFLLRHFTGVDFNCYKKTTVERRIKKRMYAKRKTTIKDYVKYLRENTEEVDALFKDLLINVTSFFRDAQAFKTLKKKVFPMLLRNKRADQYIRIWVPACSTGEEVYSLAICLLESLGSKTNAYYLQIFGTDVNEAVISKARRGLYPESIRSIQRDYLLREA